MLIRDLPLEDLPVHGRVEGMKVGPTRGLQLDSAGLPERLFVDGVSIPLVLVNADSDVREILRIPALVVALTSLIEWVVVEYGRSEFKLLNKKTLRREGSAMLMANEAAVIQRLDFDFLSLSADQSEPELLRIRCKECGCINYVSSFVDGYFECIRGHRLSGSWA